MKPAPILDLGAPGSGKTTALVTVLGDPDFKLIYLATDPNGEQALKHALDKVYHVKDWQGRVFVKTISPGTGTIQGLKNLADIIGNSTYQDLCKKSRVAGEDFRQYNRLIAAMEDFTCDWSGTKLGHLAALPYGYVLGFDGLTGLSSMCRDLVIGAKPALHEGEWGVAMNMVERTIAILMTLPMPVIVLAHIEREVDLITGETKIMASTLGKKLAPKLAGMGFGEIILSRKEGDKYFWSNTTPGVDTKKVILQAGNDIYPSYAPFFEYWKLAKGDTTPATT